MIARGLTHPYIFFTSFSDMLYAYYMYKDHKYISVVIYAYHMICIYLHIHDQIYDLHNYMYRRHVIFSSFRYSSCCHHVFREAPWVELEQDSTMGVGGISAVTFGSVDRGYH